MGDSGNVLPPSKKRAAGREISRDNPGLDDDDDSTEQAVGTFQKASDEVLAKRKILRVRRHPEAVRSLPSSQPPPPAFNPFAGIKFVLPTETALHVESKESSVAPKPASAVSHIESPSVGKTKVQEDKSDDSSKETAEATITKKASDEEPDMGKDARVLAPDTGKNDPSGETEKGKDNDTKISDNKIEEPVAGVVDKVEEKACDISVDNLNGIDKPVDEEKKDNDGENAEQNAEGMGLSSFQQLSSNKNAFTGFCGTGFSTSTFSFGPLSESSSPFLATSALFANLSNNGTSIVSKSEPIAMQEVPVETGEENEKVAFTADSVLFEYLDGGWKERGKGELKVNVSTTGAEKARLLMRAKGNYRLILNASLYPEIKLTNMDKRGVTFACINSISEGKDGLSTFALKFKDVSIKEEFCASVAEHKDKVAESEKTLESSPKALDE